MHVQTNIKFKIMGFIAEWDMHVYGTSFALCTSKPSDKRAHCQRSPS